jgi:hypothetical protein
MSPLLNHSSTPLTARKTSEPLNRLVVDDDAAVVTSATEPVFSMLTAYQEGSVIVQPPYQRRAFWDRTKKAVP